MDEIVSVSDSACVIEFIKIGRTKNSWIAELELLDHPNMLASIRSHNALRSQDIDFTWNPQTKNGLVLAGARTVGTWRMLSGHLPEECTIST